MNKKITYCSIFLLFVESIFVLPVFSGMSCEGTQYNGNYYRKGQIYPAEKNGVKYECEACGGCRQIGDGSSRGFSSAQQMGGAIMAELFRNAFDFSFLYDPPDNSNQRYYTPPSQNVPLTREQQEQIQRQIKEREERRARIGEWMKMQEESANKLVPFSVETSKAFEDAPPNRYETSKLAEMEKLLCAASFSNMAEKSASSGNLEGARFYGSQMDNIMQSMPIAIECKPPNEISKTSDMRNLAILNKTFTNMATIYREVTPKIEKLQVIEKNIEKDRKKKKEAENKIIEMDQKINEIKTKNHPINMNQNKINENELIAQAIAIKSEAEKQKQESIESEAKLMKERQSVENELNAIKARQVPAQRTMKRVQRIM